MNRVKIFILCVFLIRTVPVFAAGHYVAGVEGIEAATVPPPGLYYLAYLVNYNIKEISGVPGNNSGTVSALVNRFIWIGKMRFLGADVGVEADLPVLANSLTFNGNGYSGTSRGLGDILLGPLLAWHGSKWDTSFSIQETFDTGSYSAANPSSVGHGYDTTLFTVGGTYYPDQKRKWSLSALMRFEKNSMQSQTHITPGDGFTLEWGVGREIGGGKKVGLVGYYQAQTSNNSGPAANPLNPRKSGIGVEFDYPIPDNGLFLKFAGYTEYSASRGATKGNLLRMTFAKVF
ncbi:metA-pathway of phenol degradation family protein [Paraburkholderia fungorum]|uniref:MetA-pathway of phenol degradation family protein n=1 Tax=Paraburkholderia fungorum TaxID=134537 RepID=A0AAU8T559_9BURK|nr:transporter [Paraburkholderia fungorum]AJZ61047.1 metA-pathway of phenol degradation family protein [Paraburkholderia fungorum]